MRYHKSKRILLLVIFGLFIIIYIGISIYMAFLRTECKIETRNIQFIYKKYSDKEDIEIPSEDILQNLTLEELSFFYQRYITTLQTFCALPKRFGHGGYRGFRICADVILGMSTRCTINSYNFKLSSLFNSQVKAKYNCRINCHDNSPHLSTWKFMKRICSRESKNDQNILILKIDHNDFMSLSILFHNIRNLNVRQLILEIHFDTKLETKEKYVDLLTALRVLRILNCSIYWYERNWELQSDFRSYYTRTNCFTVNMICGPKSDMVFPNPYLEDPIDLLTDQKDDEDENEKVVAKYISRHQILCKQILRMGRIDDEGWDICNDKRYRPRTPCLVYSFGINYDSSFIEAMENYYGCDVHSFDLSMRRGEHKYPKNINFYQVGLSNVERKIYVKNSNLTWELKTLKTMIHDLGHTGRRIDILKIDINEEERESLVEMITSGALRNVAQLHLELHRFHVIDTVIKLYEIGFRIFWSQQNPLWPLYYQNETFSYSNKVSFINIYLA